MNVLQKHIYLDQDMGPEFRVPLPMILEYRVQDGEDMGEPSPLVVAVYFRVKKMYVQYLYSLEGVRVL